MTTRFEEIPATDTSAGAADAYALVLLNADGYLDITLFDGDIGGLGAITGTGVVVRTASGTYATRTLTAPAEGLTITNPAGIAGNPTFAFANDLGAIEALNTTGLPARTGTDTWALRTLTAPAAGLTITNPAGIAGNPTFALANDLSALEALAANGIGCRTGTSTWSVRTLTAPAAGITVTNGGGVSGNPTLALANDLAALEALSGAGIACHSITADTWNLREIAVGSSKLSINNGTGSGGNPTLDVNEANLTLDNIGGTLGTTKGGSLSGTYTPTLSNIANCVTMTASVCQYMRAGNVVTVSGKFNTGATTSSTATYIGITLPVSSALANDFECGGAGGRIATPPIPVLVNAEPTNNVARAYFYPPNTATADYFFSFTYLII